MKTSAYCFEYHISFRITHPTLDLADAAKEILTIPGIELGRMWKVGEKRTTPRGDLLEGVNRNSYCYFQFGDERKNALIHEDLEEAMEGFLDKLYPHKSLLHEIVETGGGLDFYIGMDVDQWIGLEFHDELIAKLAELKVSFGLDIGTSDEENARHWGIKDRVMEKVRIVIHRHDLSGIIDPQLPQTELHYDPYQDVFGGIADLIKAGAGEEKMSAELKEMFEYFTRTKSEKLPKTVDGYSALARELVQVKWKEEK